jgi:hypothetical protein
MSTDNPEGQLALSLPFRLANQRLAMTFEGGILRRELAHTVTTLPGVAPATYSTDLKHGYFEIGATYHPTRLPKTTFDPYLRAGAGLIDANSKYLLVTAGGGLDLLVSNRITAFVELDFRRETVQDSTLLFNRYGEAGVSDLQGTSVHGRVMAGLRFSLNIWPIQ